MKVVKVVVCNGLYKEKESLHMGKFSTFYIFYNLNDFSQLSLKIDLSIEEFLRIYPFTVVSSHRQTKFDPSNKT